MHAIWVGRQRAEIRVAVKLEFAVDSPTICSMVRMFLTLESAPHCDMAPVYFGSIPFVFRNNSEKKSGHTGAPAQYYYADLPPKSLIVWRTENNLVRSR